MPPYLNQTKAHSASTAQRHTAPVVVAGPRESVAVRGMEGVPCPSYTIEAEPLIVAGDAPHVLRQGANVHLDAGGAEARHEALHLPQHCVEVLERGAVPPHHRRVHRRHTLGTEVGLDERCMADRSKKR